MNRPATLGSWMNRPATLAILGLAGLVVACSAGAYSTPSTATSTPTGEATVGALFHRTGEAGLYRSSLADPEVILTLPDGWELFFDEAGGTYMGIPNGEFLLGRPMQVIDPKSHAPAPVPEDLLAWLTQHPNLKATDPTSVEISGFDAGFVEISPTRSVDVFYDPLGNFHVGPGPMARFYVIPWEGADIFVAVMKSENGGSFEQALELGVPIVESLEIAK
jgi:hypothetical protein